MPRFSLTFEVLAENEEGVLETSQNYSRVVGLQGGYEAELIGRAMIGEEIDQGERLSRLVGVEETDKPHTICWEDKHVWRRVLEVLGCSEDGVIFERNSEGRIIGLFFIPI